MAQSYQNETGKSISKTTIDNILRNTFKLSYLKTTIKNHKIVEDSGIFSAFYFVKTIVKYINLGFKLSYMDETSYLSVNNNFISWRERKEEIYF